VHPETLTVALGERSYPLHFSASPIAAVRSQVEALERQGRRVAVLTNRTIAQVQAKALAAMFGAASLARATSVLTQGEDAPGPAADAHGGGPAGDSDRRPIYCVDNLGESAKSLQVLELVLDFLAAQRLDRTSALFVVGGGVIGDLGGFAAACYLRGIEYYQIPTTLLAMVDSSVGGKTGINLAAGKNLVGAFHQPRGVFIATDFLQTLPAREFAAGMAEVIKTALVGDPALWARLEALGPDSGESDPAPRAAGSGARAPLTPESPDLAEVIRRCCALKAAIVQADERELNPDGGRALLNLGHTFGHAIEQVAGYGTYLHGEAVAIGLAAATRLSVRLGLIGREAAARLGPVERIERVLLAHALPIRLRARLPLDDLMAAMARDKKVRSGKLRFIVPTSRGEATVAPQVGSALVEVIWKEIGAG
jgi:3-dehydroquinate synthase